MNELFSLVDWSRAQFALTAMYHWLFVPLTLGLAVIVGIMETIYYRTGSLEWKQITKFWMKLFGVNFAVGIATGIILEFQFGTNWSNYSWFVGDIFGAPLAIEGIMAFFMEATFLAVMFFGWERVSRGFHLTATWLTALGASLSALWILIANAWMQYPVGMTFNPDMVRNEMTDFAAVVLSPVAINKFVHSVSAGWVLGAVFVVGVSAWFMLKRRHIEQAKKSIRIASWVGLAGVLLVSFTGDGSAYEVAQKQPMKLAAMEGVYDGEHGQELILFGILNPEKEYDNDEEPFCFKIGIPNVLAFLATRDADGFVPGVNDIIDGGYATTNFAGDAIIAPSAQEKMRRGDTAIEALGAYRTARANGETAVADSALHTFRSNYEYFGYGYLDDEEQLIPHIPLVFYSFHVMIILGGYFVFFFLVVLFMEHRHLLEKQRWLQWICLWSIPLGYICLQSGWIVAEVGRQPWTIQDILPTVASISAIDVASVQTTFWLFAAFFTIMLVAAITIMVKQIKKGFAPQPLNK